MAKRATDLDRILGARLRAARIESHQTQEQVAKHLGLTFQQIQKYEKGVTRVSAIRLTEFAKRYDRSIDSLLDGIAASPTGDGTDLGTRALATAAGRELLEAFLAIGDAGSRAALVQMARKLAGAPASHLQAAE